MDLDFSQIEEEKKNFIEKMNNLKKLIESQKLTFDEGINYLVTLWDLYKDYKLKYLPLGNLLNRMVKNKDLKPKPTPTKKIISEFLQADRKLIDLINARPQLLRLIKKLDCVSIPKLHQYTLDTKSIFF